MLAALRFSSQAPGALKQLPQSLRFPVRYHQLASNFSLTLALVCVAVANIQALEVEAVEGAPDVRVIVDADHHPALAPTHEVGHALVLLEGEVHSVAGGLPIRRVHVEERVRSIIAFGASEPRQILDIGAGETLPRSGKVLFNTQQVGSRPSGRRTEGLPGDLAAERMLLQVEEAGSTLDVGSGFQGASFSATRRSGEN